MTKRKREPLLPEDFDCVSIEARLFENDGFINLRIKDDARLSIGGGARAFARNRFASALPNLRYCWTYGDADYRAGRGGTEYLVRGNFPGKREITAQWNMAELEQELSAEHFALFVEFYDALIEQARMVHYMCALAKAELATTERRSRGGSKTGQARSEKAKKQIRKLQAEEAKLRKLDPTMKKEAVAATLADRGLGRKGVIEKQLRLASKKSLEGK